MNMNSQCLWEKGGSVDINSISVVLQQVSSRRKDALLACVCEGFCEAKEAATQSGYFTERLVEWFHGKFLKKLLEHGKETEITKALEEELEKSLIELERYGRRKGGVNIQYSGILIRNTQCWIFEKGEMRILLFNRRYNKEHAREIELPSDAMVWEGRVQKNVGVLVCSKAFKESISKEEFLTVLFQGKRCDEERVEKRLKELWREGEAKGLKRAGAVYIRTY